MLRRVPRILAVSLMVIAPALAQAGPPLVCFPMMTGNAASLPWGTGSGWNEPRADYDLTHLATDTAALLGPQVRVLERMETLRRAVIYASKDASAATQLFTSLRTRAGNSEAEKANALAVFDLGYAVEAFRETRGFGDFFRGGPSEDGYALIRRALTLRGTEPEMEYAAALVTADHTFRGLSDKHLRIAVQGAAPDSLLAKTIAAHRPLWGGRAEAYRTASTTR